MIIKGKEIRFINFLKGGLIFLVVLGHVLTGDYSHVLTDSVNWRGIIYLFHMPIFFYVSGYLFKLKTSKEEFVIWFKQLFLTFLISVIIYQLLFVRQFSVRSIIEMLWSPFNHLWYLVALLIYGALFYFLFRINTSAINKVLLYLSFIVFIILKSTEIYWNTPTFWWLNKSILRPAEYFFFFLLAFQVKSKTVKLPSVLVASILIFISTILLFFNDTYFEFLNFNFRISYAFAYGIFNFSLIIFIDYVINIKQDVGVNIIDDIGRNSLFIYLWHFAVILILEKIIVSNNLLFLIFESAIITLCLHYTNQFLNRNINFKYKGLLGLR